MKMTEEESTGAKGLLGLSVELLLSVFGCLTLEDLLSTRLACSRFPTMICRLDKEWLTD